MPIRSFSGQHSARWIATLGCGIAACAVTVAVVRPPTAESRPHSPKVICITSFKPPEGAYRYRPHKCTFHRRHQFPITGANTYPTGHLHWKHWSQNYAIAKGKFYISTYGPAPAKIKLTRPRSPCGTTVFTKLLIRYRTHFNGHTHHDHFRATIDNCLS